MRILSIALVAALASASSAQKPPQPKPAVPERTENMNLPAPAIGGPGPRLTLVESVRIAGKNEPLQGDFPTYLGPGGRVVFRPGWRTLQAYDSTGRPLWSMELRKEDIGDVTALGWFDAQVWISDRRNSQIALVEHGHVTKSIELPSWVRPPWAERRNFPVFASMEVYARFDDGSMLVVPESPHTLGDVPGYDSTAVYVLRVSDVGIIKQTIAKVPSRDAALRAARARFSKMTESLLPGGPLFNDPYWPHFRISPDGMRTVTVTVDTSHANADTVIIAAVNDQGAPVYTTKFGFPRKTFSPREIDSIANQMQRQNRLSVTDLALRARWLPRHMPTVFDLMLGRDYSVWVTLREIDGAKPVVGIDPSGRVIGTAYIPKVVNVKAGDRDHLWAVSSRWAVRDLVGYRIVRK